jgi:hypothetical protein
MSFYPGYSIFISLFLGTLHASCLPLLNFCFFDPFTCESKRFIFVLIISSASNDLAELQRAQKEFNATDISYAEKYITVQKGVTRYPQPT